ncbi:hypothetical protein [Streptomyces cinnamoneus]|nr:hypothetical protein [Streptomyces cinnamoneus]
MRDDANRTVMRAEKAEITYQLAALRGHPPTKYQQKYNNITGLPLQGVQEITPQWKKWEEQIEDLEKKKAGIETINRRIAETGGTGWRWTLRRPP